MIDAYLKHRSSYDICWADAGNRVTGISPRIGTTTQVDHNCNDDILQFQSASASTAPTGGSCWSYRQAGTVFVAGFDKCYWRLKMWVMERNLCCNSKLENHKISVQNIFTAFVVSKLFLCIPACLMAWP